MMVHAVSQKDALKPEGSRFFAVDYDCSCRAVSISDTSGRHTKGCALAQSGKFLQK